MQQKLIKLSIFLLIAIIPLKIQAGITMSNMLEFIIGENEKLEGPILSPRGKRWGLIYQKNNECYVMINLEKFGPFDHCEKLKFSAIDNFSFVAKKTVLLTGSSMKYY